MTDTNRFFFVIYEHGINNTEAICTEIENSGIIIDKKINVQFPFKQFTNFIVDIYPDTNKKHVKLKNKFIINYCKRKNLVRAVILLTTVENWTKHHYGKFGFKCKQVEDVKRKIRNLYNPKSDNRNLQVNPLNKGVSHNHVIHSIDFPNEFPMIYDVIKKYTDYIIDVVELS